MSCPIYLSPATARTKPIRLHQVWQPAPADVDEDDLPGRGGEQQGSERSVTRLHADSAAPDGEQSPVATRITLRPHDPGTGEEIEKREVVKGYEYSRGQFLTFTAEELKALDVESSKVVDLEKFVAGDDIDPIYFDSPYYVYPDGPIAVEICHRSRDDYRRAATPKGAGRDLSRELPLPETFRPAVRPRPSRRLGCGARLQGHW